MADNHLFSQLFATEKQIENIEEKPIDDIKKDLEKITDKISFLKRLLDKIKEVNKKRQVRELLINEIKSKNKGAQYFMGYDSVAEGLEPVYFWLLDFLRNKPLAGIGYEVDKTKEDFEASVGSAFFGEIGGRGTRMQEQAMKMMGTINTVVRSIINLIYDLKKLIKSVWSMDRGVKEYVQRGKFLSYQLTLNKTQASIVLPQLPTWHNLALRGF